MTSRRSNIFHLLESFTCDCFTKKELEEIKQMLTNTIQNKQELTTEQCIVLLNRIRVLIDETKSLHQLIFTEIQKHLSTKNVRQ